MSRRRDGNGTKKLFSSNFNPNRNKFFFPILAMCTSLELYEVSYGELVHEQTITVIRIENAI